MRHFLFVLLAILAAPVSALDEATVFDKTVAYLTRDADCSEATTEPGWERRVLTMPRDGYRLRYSRFGCAPGAKGALVIAPGRSEPSYEYVETAMDFIARGFAPVYVIDHRGQGLSPRLLADPDKSHVEDFGDYIADFTQFVAAVEADLSALGASPDLPLFLTSNSMGGAIAIGYLQKVGGDTPFAAAALVSAMIHVNYISYTGKRARWLNLRIYSESGVAVQGWWRCAVAWLWNDDLCHDYASARTFGPYQPGTRSFEQDAEAMMTRSRARYALRTHMWDHFDWSGIRKAEYAGENWQGPQIGGTTNSWARGSVRFLREMRAPDSLARMVDTPVLLLSGTRDLRAYRQYPGVFDAPPDLSRHTGFCDDLNAASLAADKGYACQFSAINGAFHEIYKERDATRNTALDMVEGFFLRHVR
ncbi:serine aminopeptidase domain-containing protein [Antarctobacter sp.]|uniref:serine aminopeptidase domain-containing protein n=1 Tax=Antarctobacter sp. TaxID=1872577 RepID=UPI003A8E9C3D